jgi:hypothetical protein
METRIKLHRDDLVNGRVLQSVERIVLRNVNGQFVVHGDTPVDQSLGAQERAHMLCAKGWFLVVLC